MYHTNAVIENNFWQKMLSLIFFLICAACELLKNAVHEISFSFLMMYMKTSILILCCSGIANIAYRDTSENTIPKYTSER